MRSRSCVIMLAGSLVSVFLAGAASAQVPRNSARVLRYERLRAAGSLVAGPVTTLAYTPDDKALYYSMQESDSIGTYRLDLATGGVEPLFDTGRLRAAVGAALGRSLDGRGTPFPGFRFDRGNGGRITFVLDGKRWTLDLASYDVRPLERAATPETASRPGVIRPGEFGRSDLREVLSPDGSTIATLDGHDAALRDVASGSTRRITVDGTADRYWGYTGVATETWAWWSPGGELLALRKVDMEGVDSIPLVRWLETPPRVEWVRNVHNVRGGQTLPREALSVWHRDSGQLVRLDVGDPTDAYLYVLGWRAGGSELIVLRVTRDYRDVRILALDPETGSRRTVLSEQYASCWSEQVWAPPLRRYWPLSDGQRFLWKAENDGWDHLFLRDYDGHVLAQLTRGKWQVDDVIGIDEAAGWVYFSARTDSSRPYDVHIHRVKLDGSGFTRLTDEPGRYAAELHANSKVLEVWRRRVDAPTELQIRRANGELLRRVGSTDLSRLRAAGWTPPEEFTVKAADGKTDLWGIMYKPRDFDPSRKYPIIEFIYGGPVVEEVPHAIPYPMFPQALAQLGYVVIKLDARGTPGRGRAFLQVGFNRPSVVIADHAAAIRELAERHPYLDLDRVGITGQSWGGDFTAQALLLAPDVYRVGVAVSGGWWRNPALGVAKATVDEQCAGLKANDPPASLDALEGDLLIVHGTADINMSGSTDLMWWLDSAIKAGKYVDQLWLPDRPHELLRSDRYVQDAIRRYFAEHLTSGGQAG